MLSKQLIVDRAQNARAQNATATNLRLAAGVALYVSQNPAAG